MFKFGTGFCALLLSCQLEAQPYTAPSGPAFDALVKEYQAAQQTHSTEGIRARLPAMEQAYPGHPYTIYFQSFLKQTSGDDGGALRGYSDAIRLMPEFSDAYAMRAMLFAAKGLYDRAIADMDKAIGIESAAAGAYWYSDRAGYKLQAGDAAGALADFTTAIGKSPSEVRFYRGAVNAALKLNDPGRVEALFTSALAGTQQQHAALRVEYANLLLRRQQWAAADTQYRLALATADYSPDSKDYNGAGIAAYKLKDYPRARALLTKASGLDPGDVDIIVNLASVAMDQMAWEDVYAYAKRALALAPQSSRANMIMAVGIRRTGRGEAQAAEYEARAKRLDTEGN